MLIPTSMPGLKKIAQSILGSYHKINATYREAHEMKFFIRRTQLEEKILHSAETGISDQKYCEHDIIVSLTTYGRRIHDVCFTIESLMQQTYKANKIILWIDHESAKDLPSSLIRLQNRGLTIFPTRDIRSYTKLIPALKHYPDAIIITVDDDMIYDFDLIERLVKSYVSSPCNIHACRVHSMTFDINSNLLPYSKWDWCKSTTHKRHFLTGVGGVLYPPGSLNPEIFNECVFSKICPTADDVWFTAMAKLNGTQILKVDTRSINGEDYTCNQNVQDMGLINTNLGQNGKNDEQIKAVFTKYGIYDLIR